MKLLRTWIDTYNPPSIAIETEDDGFSQITQGNQEAGPVCLWYLRNILAFINIKQLVPCNMKLISFDDIACITESTNTANNPIARAETTISHVHIQRS